MIDSMEAIDEKRRDDLIKGFFKLSSGKDLSPEELNYRVGIWWISMEITQRKWKAFTEKFPLTSADGNGRPDPRKFTFLALVLFWFKERGQLDDSQFDRVFTRLKECPSFFVKERDWIKYHCDSAFNALYKFPKRIPELMLRLGFEAYVLNDTDNADSENLTPSGQIFERLQNLVPCLTEYPDGILKHTNLSNVKRTLKDRDKKLDEFFEPELTSWVKSLKLQKFEAAKIRCGLRADTRLLKSLKSIGGIGGLALHEASFVPVKDKRS